LKLKELLKAVVENGTGTKAKVDGISVAGKTGTAEKYIENVGYRKDTIYHHSQDFPGR